MKHSYTAPSLHHVRSAGGDGAVAPPRGGASAYMRNPTKTQYEPAAKSVALPYQLNQTSRMTLSQTYVPRKHSQGYDGWTKPKLAALRMLNLGRFKQFERAPPVADDDDTPTPSSPPPNAHQGYGETNPGPRNLDRNDLMNWTAPSQEEIEEMQKHKTPRWGYEVEEYAKTLSLGPKDQEQVRRAQSQKPIQKDAVTIEPEGHYPEFPPSLPTLLPGGRAPLAWENALFLSRLEEMFNANTQLGLNFSRNGEYPKAVGCHQRALQAAVKLQHMPRQNLALGNLGLSCFKMDDYEWAEHYFLQHLELSSKMQDRRGCYRSCKHLGEIAVKGDRPQDATHFFEKALAISGGGATQTTQETAKIRVGMALGNFKVDSVLRNLGRTLAGEVPSRTSTGRRLSSRNPSDSESKGSFFITDGSNNDYT